MVIHSHEAAVAKIHRMLDFMDKPVSRISTQQQCWQDQADSLSLRIGKKMVVINQGGDHFQVWGKEIADQCGAEAVYVTESKE